MFSLFKSTDKLTNSFFKDLANSNIQMVAIDLGSTSLKCQWSCDTEVYAVDLLKNKVHFTNQKSKTFKSDNSEHIDTIREIIRSTLLEQFELAKNEIHNAPNIDSPQDGELKGQEWVKVTNTLLKNSYEKAQSDSSLYVEGKIFIGRKSKNDNFTIRFQSFNLDYSYNFMPNSKIFMNIYNDKNLERGSAKEASYSGEFYNNRPQMLDQILSLISDCIKASSFRIFS